MQLLDLLVHALHALFDRRGGSALQLRIERSINAQALLVVFALAQSLCQLFADQVDEVRRLARVHGSRNDVERRGLGLFGFIFGDRARLDHRIEHEIAARGGPLRVPIGIQAAGALDQPGEQGALGQGKLADILPEISLRGLSKAVDREAAALPERHLVGVHLEDFLLREAMLKLEGDDDLEELALEPLFRGQEEAARQLHGQRRAAFHVGVTMAEIVAQRTDTAECSPLRRD